MSTELTTSGLAGRVVAVTGGARGIGYAIAAAAARAGASVIIGDLESATAAGSAARMGPNVASESLDVSDPGSFDAFVAAAEAGIGPLDVLVNNAGIMPIGPWLDETPAMAEKVFAVNTLGVAIGMKLALARMVPRGRGHVINVASMAGKAAAPGAITYGASKAAVVSLTESARVEFARTGVSFTCVLPSFTQTELIAGTRGTRFVATISPADVADAIIQAIVKPRPDVWVPRNLGGLVRAQSLMGRRFRDGLTRALGADRTFLEVDTSARAAYTQRIESGTTLTLTSGESER